MSKLNNILLFTSLLILFASCENTIEEFNDFVDWSIQAKPQNNIPIDLKPISSDTLAAIIKLERESNNQELEEDDFLKEDINASRVLALIQFNENDSFISETDFKKLYYIAQAQQSEMFKIILVSEGNLGNTSHFTESITKQLLAYDVDPNNIQIMFDNRDKKDFLRVKILR